MITPDKTRKSFQKFEKSLQLIYYHSRASRPFEISQSSSISILSQWGMIRAKVMRHSRIMSLTLNVHCPGYGHGGHGHGVVLAGPAAHGAVLAGPSHHGAVLAGPASHGAVVAGPHAGGAAVSGPHAGSVVISGPSGKITAHGAGHGAAVHAGFAGHGYGVHGHY